MNAARKLYSAIREWLFEGNGETVTMILKSPDTWYCVDVHDVDLDTTEYSPAGHTDTMNRGIVTVHTDNEVTVLDAE